MPTGWAETHFGRFVLKDKTLFIFFFIIIMIMSMTSIVAARQATNAANKTDLIAQCTTPGTKCAQLSADSELRRAAQVLCPILIDLPPAEQRQERRDEIIAKYQSCVNEVFGRLKATPLPGVGTPPTTQPEVKK